MGKQDRLLGALLGSGSPPNVCWRDLTALLARVGARIRPGKGSTVAVALNGQHAYVTLSHPSLRADRGALETVRALLKRAGLGAR